MSRYQPHEIDVLAPYVSQPIDWPTVEARLPHRSRASIENRIIKMRRSAGTLWRITRKRTKLTDEQVAEIRQSTESYAEVARRYGIDDTYARRLRLGLK